MGTLGLIISLSAKLISAIILITIIATIITITITIITITITISIITIITIYYSNRAYNHKYYHN